jgi:hypothetical protein
MIEALMCSHTQVVEVAIGLMRTREVLWTRSYVDSKQPFTVFANICNLI